MDGWQACIGISTFIIAIALVALTALTLRFLWLFSIAAKNTAALTGKMNENLHSFDRWLGRISPAKWLSSRPSQDAKELPPETVLKLLSGVLLGIVIWKTVKKRR